MERSTKHTLLNFCRCLLSCLWLFLPGIISILISFYLFISLSQGQDVVIQVSEYLGPRLWSVTGIFLWGYAMWYSSRLISYKKGETVSDPMMKQFLIHFPRMMAFNAFLSIQAAILALPTVQQVFGIDIDGRPFKMELFGFICLNNALYFFIHFLFQKDNRPKRNLHIAAATCIIINIALWIYIMIRSIGGPEHIHYLSIYAIVLFLLQLFFVYLFIIRKEYTVNSNRVNKLTVSSKTIFETGEIDERTFFRIFNMISIIAIILYFACIGSISLADKFGALGFIMTAFGCLIGAANIIIYFSLRLRINLFFPLLLLVIISGYFYDPYRVRLVKADPQQKNYQYRPSITDYFHNWATLRKTEILARDSSHPYEVYIELADGGASRSAYWVASVLSALEDASADSNKFSNHLFCLSSASGGTVGNATFYSMLHKNAIHDLTLHAQKFLSTDFLSFTMSHFLGPDIWGHFGFIDDRAAALEEVMDGAADSLYSGAFSQTVDRYLDSSGRLPVFFFNTTEVQHGMPSVVSSVKIDDFSKRYDVLNIVDDSCENKNIRLSTAAILSSRFPYISPAGGLGKLYFVDGGYFDNSGAGIANEMMIKIDSLISTAKGDDSLLYRKLCFHLLHITNTPLTNKPNKPITSIANNLAAPIITVLNTYNSQTDVNDGRLKQYFRSDKKNRHLVDDDVNLYSPDDPDGHYPMNWVISDYQLQLMDSQLVHRINEFYKDKRHAVTKPAGSVKMYNPKKP